MAAAWEGALNEADCPRTRKVALRSAMTMGPDRGGVFDVLLGLVRRSLGSRAGTARGASPGFTARDFVRAMSWLIAHEETAGPVNLAAPNPVPNPQFMRALRQAWWIGFGLPGAGLDVRGRRLLSADGDGTGPEKPAGGPRPAVGRGVRVRLPDVAGVGRDLCRRWRERRGAGLPTPRSESTCLTTPGAG